MRLKNRVGVGAAAAALAVLASLGVFAPEAGASAANCSSGSNCIWTATGLPGSPNWSHSTDRPTISWTSRSGTNNGGGSYWACGYTGTYGNGSLNYARYPGTSMSYTYRIFQSILWKPLSAGC